MDTIEPQSLKIRYEYKPLRPGQIRLLKVDPAGTPSNIRCSIDHYDREKPFELVSDIIHDYGGDTPPGHVPRQERRVQRRGGYYALSYTWGDSKPVADISLNGRSIGVAQNLFDFLSMVALCLQDGKRPMNGHIGSETYYWIDALCINQNDQDEKTEQVQRMWQIYEDAELVLSWLGPEDDNTLKAFIALYMVELQVLPLARQQGSSKEAVKKMESPSPEDIAAVTRLTHNEYFQRAWIVQEVLNTPCPLLVLGDWGIAMNNLRWFHNKLNEEREAEPPADGCWVWDAENPHVNTHFERLMFDIQWGMTPEFANEDIVTLRSVLSHYADRHCADPRDRVFAALNLPLIRKMDPHGYMKADYSLSREDIFFMVFAFWEMIYTKNPLNSREGHCMNILQLLHNLLDIERGPTDLLLWLREPDRLKQKQNIDVLVLRSGREIDCSGDCFQDLIQNGDIAKKFCSETPDGAIRYLRVRPEREWFNGKCAQGCIPVDTRPAAGEQRSENTQIDADPAETRVHHLKVTRRWWRCW
jgi:hypothetical protein